MRTIGIIPARYGSTRLPGKPLKDISGKPMIQHVYERARRARLLDDVIVATDDQRIVEAVEGFDGTARLTSADHPTGTDRIAEVALQKGELFCQLCEEKDCVHIGFVFSLPDVYEVLNARGIKNPR